MFGLIFYLFGVSNFILLDVIIPKLFYPNTKINYPPTSDIILSLSNLSILSFFIHLTHINLQHIPPISVFNFNIFYRIMLGMILGSTIFYYSHRLLHCKRLYFIHSIHHKYKKPIASLTFYSHPIEIILNNIFSSCIPLLIIRLPNTYNNPILLIGLFNSLLSHSSILHSINNFHLTHHQKINKNYGLEDGIFDIIHNTIHKN